jgi:hypothetical protein
MRYVCDLAGAASAATKTLAVSNYRMRGDEARELTGKK